MTWESPVSHLVSKQRAFHTIPVVKSIMRSVVLLCVTLSSVAAFAPRGFVSRRTFSSSGFLKSSDLDEEIERMVQEDIAKSNKMSNLRNEKGVDYAPWMKISKEDEDRIRGIMKEKAIVRRKRQLQEQSVKGALLMDSTNQELSGTGLRPKIVDGNSVELEWATGSETEGTMGFIVKRRAAKTEDFETLASYETYGPLASKGSEGGVYRYLDENVPPGGWFYRITEVDGTSESDLSQCLVEISTPEEQKSQVIALVGFVTIAIAAVAAGIMSDPYQY